jgi:hypothetical protein
MDLDQLIRDADPSRDLSIPIPDSNQIIRDEFAMTKHRRGWRRLIPMASRTASGLALAGSVLVVIAVVAVVLAVSGHRGASTQSHPVPSARPRDTSELAVLQRPQTARDRTLPAVVRRAARLGGVNKPATQSALSGIVPSSMRYAQTLPDGREVFLARVHIPKVRQPVLRLLIVAPDGSWRHGQPIVAPSFGLPDNRIARIEALHGGGCSSNNNPSGSGRGLTDWSIEPNGVARVRWQFASQHEGQPNRKPLTLEVPVRGNTAVATVPGLTSCEQPSAITLYNRDGQIIGSGGVPANLNR